MGILYKKAENKSKGILKKKTPEVGSAVVRISHKLTSRSSVGQVVKIGDKYFRMKELG